MSAGEAGRQVVNFGDLNINIFLEVQAKKYSQILYLIDYIAYGLHLWYKILIFKEICRKPIPLHPGLGKGLYSVTYSRGRRRAAVNNKFQRASLSRRAERLFAGQDAQTNM